VANRSKDRRARSRKRRPTAAPAPETAVGSQGDAGEARSGGGGAGGKRGDGEGKRRDAEGKRGGAEDKRRGARTGAAPSKPRGGGATRVARASPTAPTYGERPHALWHPLPLSELLILVGAIVAALEFARVARDGLSSGGPGLLAGIVAVALGTIEVTLREHRSGYRSHTVMLALLLVLAFHSAVLFGLSSLLTVPRLFNVGLLAVDVALFAFLFKLFRVRFLEARHARVLREG
jgi:hypothetical protein